jgi:hypothetical protein
VCLIVWVGHNHTCPGRVPVRLVTTSLSESAPPPPCPGGHWRRTKQSIVLFSPSLPLSLANGVHAVRRKPRPPPGFVRSLDPSVDVDCLLPSARSWHHFTALLHGPPRGTSVRLLHATQVATVDACPDKKFCASFQVPNGQRTPRPPSTLFYYMLTRSVLGTGCLDG